MKRPSTVAENGEIVIIPLRNIHTTPTSGTTASTRESTRIIGRKLPPLFLFIHRLRIGVGTFTPELVAAAVDEHIFQRGLALRNCLNLAGEGFDYVWDEAVTGFLLDPNLIAEHSGRDVETAANMLGEGIGIAGGVEKGDVAANFTLQLRGCSQRDKIAFVHDG